MTKFIKTFYKALKLSLKRKFCKHNFETLGISVAIQNGLYYPLVCQKCDQDTYNYHHYSFFKELYWNFRYFNQNIKYDR